MAESKPKGKGWRGNSAGHAKAGRMGGIASGEARRRKKALREKEKQQASK